MTKSRPASPESPLRSNSVVLAVRLGRIVGNGWIIFGLSLLLLLTLEVAYRAQASVRLGLRGDVASAAGAQSPLHPNAGSDWWAAYAGGAATWRMHFDPYRGIWADPITGPYLNIDSLGRRVSHVPTQEAETVIDVWMFGGSAMWGYMVRDRHTIPSLVAEELNRRGVTGVRIHNLAQSTFNITQGVISLVLELRAGRTPDIVVFMDGNNEMAPAFQARSVGGILNQERLANRLNAPPPGLLSTVAGKLELIQRIIRQPVATTVRGDSALCPEIAWQYTNLTDVVRTLARSHGFATEFYWQPMLATSRKPRTEWENLITSEAGWGSGVAACTAVVGDSVRAREYGDFRDLGGLFDDETGSVFIDDYGHMTEASNRVVADAIVDDLVPLLTGR